MPIVIGLVLLAIVGVVVLMRLKKPGSTGTGQRAAAVAGAKSSATGGRAVGKMLRPGAGCCARAQQLASDWFPETDAPILPLPGCDRQCRCTWERVYDRRGKHRRKGDERRNTVRFDAKPDRRSGQDRRKDSKDIWKG